MGDHRFAKKNLLLNPRANGGPLVRGLASIVQTFNVCKIVQKFAPTKITRYNYSYYNYMVIIIMILVPHS